MNVNKLNQQPNFKGSLTVITHVKQEAASNLGKIVAETQEFTTSLENDASVKNLCAEIRKSLGKDTKSYSYINLSKEAANKLIDLFQSITGKKLPDNGLEKKLIDTPKGAVANRVNGFIEFGDLIPTKTGGVTYQLNLNA